ncbi:hypothetical protein DXG03_009526, partial [Asterophora parasitica]
MIDTKSLWEYLCFNPAASMTQVSAPLRDQLAIGLDIPDAEPWRICVRPGEQYINSREFSIYRLALLSRSHVPIHSAKGD